MGVQVREKDKGSGVWWIFVHHNSQRKSKKIGSKNEAERLAKILEGRLAAGQLGMKDLQHTEETEPFSFFNLQWLNSVMPAQCKPSTQGDYRSINRVHIETAPFYNSPVDQISENDIEMYLISKRKHYARSTCCHIKDALSNSMERARKAGVIDNNPCKGVTIPKDKGKASKKIAEPFDEQEISDLLAASKGSQHYAMILFLCHTGCRVGEAAGLKWNDLDLDNRKATIQRGIVRGQVINSPKSNKNRRIDLTRQLAAELKKLKLQNQKTGSWVFQNQAGKFVDTDNFRSRVWYPLLGKHGFRRTRLHDLRHSYASLLIAKTKDIYYAQRQLGHSSIAVTCDRYGHLLNEDTEVRPVDVLDKSYQAN